ncbi:hypothetical protein L1275_000131 [Flavobacterium sp. HSC-61S13]|nr:hypothetical protein [Flavobacterium sp. HSC-61S13]
MQNTKISNLYDCKYTFKNINKYLGNNLPPTIFKNDRWF